MNCVLPRTLSHLKIYNGLESSNPDSGKTFCLLLKDQTDSGCLLNLLFNCYWVSFKAVKRLGRKAGHFPATRALVKNEWSYTSIPPVSLQGVAKTTLSLTFYCFCVYKIESLLLTTDLI
jgi:hypothetical protein